MMSYRNETSHRQQSTGMLSTTQPADLRQRPSRVRAQRVQQRALPALMKKAKMNPLTWILLIGGLLTACGMLLAYVFERNAAKHRRPPEQSEAPAPSTRRRH